MKQYIYADNAATTKLDIAAFEAMKPYLLEEYGNASQPYSFSRSSKKALKEARETIAHCIGADADEIYFTSGGTESDNWAVKCAGELSSSKATVITTEIEHHAVLNACNFLETNGVPVAYLPVDNEGRVHVETLSSVITPNTKLVSIMYANNEVGTIQPIKALCEIAHQHGALFHTDAVQAVGHVEIDVKELGVDMLSASAHKFNGPKGIGFLYIKKGTPIIRFHDGGSQEFNMRSGTENVAAIVGMAVALKNNCEIMQDVRARLTSMEKTFFDCISGLDYIRNGDVANHIPGNISLSLRSVDGEMILHRMDLKGISISTGAACDSVNTQTSHVIRAIKLPQDYATGTIRISLGKNNDLEDVHRIADVLNSMMRK